MKQIIAMGGGGFSMEPDNPLLDEYILKQTGKPSPKVCFLPTASGDSDSYIVKFYRGFQRFRCQPSHLALFHPENIADLASLVLSQDVVYVGGGSTRNLLVLWREWGLDAILHEAWEQGVVLAGLSAGSLCWFEAGTSDSFGPGLTPIRCLGFLPGSHSPHYDGEPGRRSAYQALVRDGRLPDGVAADDGAALHYVGTTLQHVVSSRPHARAYRVRRTTEGVSEEPLDTTYLGG